MTQYELQVGYELGVTDVSRVYFSSDLDVARGFAGRISHFDLETGVVFKHGSLYEVEPLGAVERDPDGALKVSWSAPRARIIDVVEADVRLDPYQVTRLLGPNMAWTDGSPIYTSQGHFIPSPEQQATSSHEQLVAMTNLYPWTPLEFVNAWAENKPAGNRADPAAVPGVVLSGAEGGAVQAGYLLRARTAQVCGIRFVHGAEAFKYQHVVNALFAETSPARVEKDDVRGLVVAVHPRDGAIAAVLFTCGVFGAQVAMLLDAIAVDHRWRRQGLGSVLMLTAQQILPAEPTFAAGHCSPAVARFFAHIGYTVLRHNVALPMPLGENPNILAPVPDQCWFYRQGPI